MSYIADSYIPIKGEMYMPGEKIPDDLPESTISWLLKAKAIHRVALAVTKDNLPAANPVNAQPENTREEEDAEPEGDPEEDLDDREAEDEPVPEIDVMDGIVQEAKEESAGSTKKPGRPKKEAKSGTKGAKKG